MIESNPTLENMFDEWAKEAQRLGTFSPGTITAENCKFYFLIWKGGYKKGQRTPYDIMEKLDII